MENLVQFLPLILLIVVMWFLMIRPQKKKDKQIQEMRKGLQVGDEIVTIGGICGKIVKTKDETIIIQVGTDKVKFEMMRWAVSTVTKESGRRATMNVDDEDAPKKAMPKRLKKAANEDALKEDEGYNLEHVEAPVAEAAEATVDSLDEE